MANGINPYELADIEIARDIAQKEAIQKQKEGAAQTVLQKSKLKKLFSKEQEDALARFKKKSKGGFFGGLFSNPLISTIVSTINPLAGAILTGASTAEQGIRTKKAASNLPGLEKWKNTFLREGAEAQEDIYKKIKSNAPSLVDSIIKGVTSGVTASATGKSMQEGFKAVDKDIKLMGADKAEGKFFENLKKKYGGFSEAASKSLKENELLDKSWVKLLGKGLPEFGKEGDVTDILTMLSEGSSDSSSTKTYATEDELKQALDSKEIDQEFYDNYYEKHFGVSTPK
tara:strand:- start:4049 stop:4906 length:858 start_codon:yes stop_codon:yes gene_type:complete